MEGLIGVGLMLILLGFMVVAAGILLSSGKSGNSEVKGGGVIFLGPIPLVFGSQPEHRRDGGSRRPSAHGSLLAALQEMRYEIAY